MALRIPYPRLAQARSVESRFEACVGPNLDMAYNLARYLTQNVEDAEDAVQESIVRAYAAWRSYRGGDSRAWFLTIVRNTTYSQLRQRKNDRTIPFDADLHDASDFAAISPEEALIADVDRETVRSAVEQLPLEFREALILREMEDLSYKEIAAITGAPLGTVMSRLARARQRLQAILASAIEEEANDGM